jgi:hypothetical protein
LAIVFAGPAPAAGAPCSALVADFDQNGSSDLRLVGTSAAQILDLKFLTTATTVELDCNGDGDMTDVGDLFLSLPPATVIETVDLQLKGKDTLRVLQIAPLLVPRNLVVTFGPGGSSFRYDVLNLQAPGHLVLDLIGSTGAEDITLGLEQVDDTLVQVRGDLGAGNDTVRLTTPSSWEASALDLDLALGAGNNTLDVRGLQPLYEGTRWTLDVEGGDVAANADTLLIDTYALQEGTLLLRANLQAGNDSFRAWLPFFAAISSRFVAAVKGGAGNDRIWVTPPVGQPYLDFSEGGRIDVVLEGGPGTDTLGAEVWKSDGSTGSCRAWLLGGDQSDALVSNARVEGAGGTFDLLVHGGRGADLLYTGVVDDPAGGAMNFSPARPLLYGGDEDDDCVDFGDDVVNKLSCEVWS